VKKFPAWVWGFSSEGIKEGYLLKRHYFATIGLFSVKTVADRYKHAAYYKSTSFYAFTMTLNDLELPKRGFSESQFLAAAHILRVNCKQMLEDRPRQPAYEIFSIKL